MMALLATLGVFGLILILARVKVPLSAAILSGAVVLGAVFGLGTREIGRAVFTGAVRPSSIGLAVITILLLSLSQSMRAGGQLERIVSLAKAFLRRPAVAMATLPALIGLLPMPGGALFSAPMVESAAGGSEKNRAKLSAINYWFRHIWEHWWPLYPGVILAAELTERPIEVFIVQQFPLGVFMALSGLVVFRGMRATLDAAGRRADNATAMQLLGATSSIWIVLLVWAAGTAAVRLTVACGGLGEDGLKRGEIPSALVKYGPLTAGLVVSLLWTAWLNGLGTRSLGRIFANRSLYGLALLVVSVMVFQQLLSQTRAAGRIGAELRALHVSALLVVCILPFIAGMVTGLAVGFVGASFPIVQEMVYQMPGGSFAAYMVLAYACGHLGQMLSPLHLCQIVSNRYFNTTYGPVYRRIVPAATILLVLAVMYFLLLRMMGI